MSGAGQPTSLPTNSYKVVWFPPDRPVEGNTIYVRPAADFEPVATPDPTTPSGADD
jgi:hypothetical protein